MIYIVLLYFPGSYLALKLRYNVLESPGGIGWKVRSWGPRPCVDADKVFNSEFWIDGRKGQDERFQTLINSWRYHNKEVVLPDNILLMTYGLVPRHLEDGTVCWDDPQAPVYDVLRVGSLVDWGKGGKEPSAKIEIRRDYLEDYCSLKGCAAVAVYYEERRSIDDETILEVLKGENGNQFNLSGRLLGLSILNETAAIGAPQFARAWGCRTIIIPERRPITDDCDPQLEWPDHPGAMTYERASAEWLYAYVRDEVLCAYETRPEFDVSPESGSVAYDGWWATSYVRRFGRNHIKVELKKLYEGCPPHVIEHWHNFSSPQKMAEHDLATHGDKNIAIRAKDVVEAYLFLTRVLEELSDAIGSGFTQKDIGSFDSAEVEYFGWWTNPEFKSLSETFQLNADQDKFLCRAVKLFQVLEKLKSAPLRNLVLSLGIGKKQVTDFESLKLLACLSQLSSLATDRGYSLVDDKEEVARLWDSDAIIEPLGSIFAINGLRICASHPPSKEQRQKVATKLAVFGVDEASTLTGWGYALDLVYERMANDLTAIATLIRRAI